MPRTTQADNPMLLSLRPVFVGWITLAYQLPLQPFFTSWCGIFFGGMGLWLRIAADGSKAPFVICGALAFVGIPLTAYVGKKLNYRRTEYRFYPDRLEFEEGFFILNKKVIKLADVKAVTLQNGLLQQRCGLGTIHLATLPTDSFLRRICIFAAGSRHAMPARCPTGLAKTSGKSHPDPSGDMGKCLSRTEPMYVANTKRLTSDGARKMMTTAIGKARDAGIAVSVAIVDAGGHLILLERMDGGRFHSVHSATTKAVCAASNKRPTSSRGAQAQSLDVAHALGLALAAGPERWTAMEGGCPIIMDGECTGGIGVAGGDWATDERIAQAAVESIGASWHLETK